MDLNKDENLALARKGAYAEQLLYYSKLCQAYQNLANYAKINRKISLAPEIEKKYAKSLTQLVTSQNIKQTLEELSNEKIENRKKFSSEEIKYLENFANATSIFKNFQMASKLLEDASNVTDIDRSAKLDEFHNFMRESDKEDTIKDFDKLISVHCHRYLGSRFFLITSKSINEINKIDSSHIPLDLSIIKEKITPQKFGAIITGHKTIIDKINSLENGQPETKHFNPYIWNLNNNINSKSHEAEEDSKKFDESYTYKFMNMSKYIYKANKKVLKKACSIATSLAIALGAMNIIDKEVKAKHINIDDSLTKYQQTITNETKEYLYDIMDNLNLQKNSFDPQYQDVKDIEENIDLLLDYIVKDQVTTAFENYHKDCKVTNVESWYDEKYKSMFSDQQNDYRFITITYIDKDRKEQKETISDFRSKFISQNPLNDIFEDEEKIEKSPVWSAFHDTDNKNFLERAYDIDAVMKYLEELVENAKHYAALDIIHGHSFFGVPYLKSTLPTEFNPDLITAAPPNNNNSNNSKDSKERE